MNYLDKNKPNVQSNLYYSPHKRDPMIHYFENKNKNESKFRIFYLYIIFFVNIFNIKIIGTQIKHQQLDSENLVLNRRVQENPNSLIKSNMHEMNSKIKNIQCGENPIQKNDWFRGGKENNYDIYKSQGVNKIK